MKAKYILVALLAIIFWGCDDNTDNLGLGMFPDNDQDIKGKLSTYDVTTESVSAGEIYAKTNIGYVGKFTDNLFGTYEAGFLAQLVCVPQLTFPETYKVTGYDSNNKPIKAKGAMADDLDNIGLSDPGKANYTVIKDAQGNVIGNCQINIYLKYSSYFGDSLTACRLSVYELGGEGKETLSEDDAYYTNIVPEKFYDKNTGLLGTKAYTAVDLTVSDSVRSESGYVPYVGLRLSKSVTENIGLKLFAAEREYGEDFYKHFQEQFKGVYVKSDFGDGTILYVDQVQMDVISICYETDSITGVKLQKSNSNVDSVYYTRRSFFSTREVLQANRLFNDEEAIAERIAEKNCTYLKSPAGIFTEATLPIADIEKQLPNDTLNAVKLTFTNYNHPSDKKFGLPVPSKVLLIRAKDQKSFFENNDVNDDISSYLADHSSTNQYVFSNISKLISLCIHEKEAARQKAGSSFDEEAWMKENEDWNKVVLIPVLVSTDSSSSTTTVKVIKVQHDLKPTYVKLKGGPGNDPNASNEELKLKLEVISTDFGLKASQK